MNQNLSGRNLNETREAAISVTEGKDAFFLGACLGLEELEEEQRHRD